MTSAAEEPSGTDLDRLRPHAHDGSVRHGGRFPSIVDAIGAEMREALAERIQDDHVVLPFHAHIATAWA